MILQGLAAMGSVDFWYNEQRLPELIGGTWKKKGGESGNQSYNEVKVRANVLEIVEVNQTNENFCVIFTLVFAYVDPTLRKTYLKTAYLEKGEVKEELAQVWGTTRSDSGESVLVLKVEEKGDRYVYVRKSDLLSIEPVKWENHMVLDWTFLNIVEDKSEKQIESRRVEYFDADGGHVSYKLKFCGTFSDSLDLKRLPYDRQLLRIQVQFDGESSCRWRDPHLYDEICADGLQACWITGLLASEVERGQSQVECSSRLDG